MFVLNFVNVTKIILQNHVRASELKERDQFSVFNLVLNYNWDIKWHKIIHCRWISTKLHRIAIFLTGPFHNFNTSAKSETKKIKQLTAQCCESCRQVAPSARPLAPPGRSCRSGWPSTTPGCRSPSRTTSPCQGQSSRPGWWRGGRRRRGRRIFRRGSRRWGRPSRWSLWWPSRDGRQESLRRCP